MKPDEMYIPVNSALTDTDYFEAFERIYAASPKITFAAIAYAFALRLYGNPEAAIAAMMKEWALLEREPQRAFQ